MNEPLAPCPFCGGPADYFTSRMPLTDKLLEHVSCATKTCPGAIIAWDPAAWNTRPLTASILARVPGECDGKEQDAFEAWAASCKFDMTTHPLHWLFLNKRTYAARQGWKAAIEYCRQTIAGKPESAVSDAAGRIGGSEK